MSYCRSVYPERTEFLIDFLNLNGTGHDFFEPPNNDWLDWTLHVSTVSDGKTLTATLRFNEARKLGGTWWRWSGEDIDDLRRAWKPGQLYKLRLMEDPRSQRTPKGWDRLSSPLTNEMSFVGTLADGAASRMSRQQTHEMRSYEYSTLRP